MKTCVRAFFALLIFALPSIIIATEISVENQNLENQYWQIDSLFNTVAVIENKVYIQPDSIYISPNQIYVRIEGDLIPIQHLSCDGSGVFISIEDIQTGRGRQETWICRNPDCRYENYVGIDYCGLCGWSRNPEDEK